MSLTAVTHSDGIASLRQKVRQGLAYCHQVWDCRYFWLSLAWLDVQRKYRRTNFGLIWALLPPLAMATVLSVVFHRFFEVGFLEYIPSAMVGLCFWNYFTNLMQQGCVCIFMSETYIRQCRTPLAIYPLRVILATGFNFLLVLAVGLIFQGAVHGLNFPALLHLVPAFLLLFLFGWALAVITGFLNVYVPDFRHFLEIGLNMLFYVTPIMYTRAMVQKQSMAWLVDWNPLSAMIAVIRDPILEGHGPAAATLAVACGTVCVLIALAVFTLVKYERKIIFRL